ncbi:transposase IS204/IS1001/IS1096/IS1165 family protein [Acidithiobacillus ferrivorans SS3]|uniref:Transposase IS204/IS1001/IS1096/IS1165 family protein n=1 Tax=Acidithiobacillus ferrivorans SS3 TaxID=743299 RepID=G0JP11_9PROT|nr:transposase IS204/IS1001/IS1096/IS1165 family protein [Acidithiobacillus ferrivorans SS3]
MMDEDKLFTVALGLVPPWLVDHVTFTVEEKRLDLHINFPKGSRLACPECGQECPVHDTVEQKWRHMDFFQHETYLHARAPRVKCPEHGVRKVEVPWARPGSHFTLLFEGLLMTLIKHMPVKTVADLVGEHDTRLWRVVEHYVNEARAAMDMSAVRNVGLDETSNRRGHDYITLFVDLEAQRLLFATPGKDAKTVEAFATDLAAHGGDPKAIEEVSMDLSPAFQKGAAEHLPKAQITFDRFHLTALVNVAVDAVRRAEVHEQPDLKKTRWIWLKNTCNLKPKQQKQLDELKDRNLKTAFAYQLRLTFQQIFTLTDRHQGATLLKGWIELAKESALPPLVKVAYTMQNHWDGILHWFESHLSNGTLEGFNSLLQSAKSRARGYRTHKNFINMAYLVLGKLDLKLPT